MIVLIPDGNKPPGVRAELSGGRWACPDRRVQTALNRFAAPGQLRGYWPNEGVGIMELVLAAYPGATLIRSDPDPPIVPGRLY